MSQSTAIQKKPDRADILKRIVMTGDLSDLSPAEQIEYYIQRCERLGLDPSSKPFDFLETKDKESGRKKITLYPNKECAAQLIKKEQVSIERLERSEENGVYTIIAHVRTPDGRTGINLSVAKIKGLEGKNYENAVKRCATQAIRRAILMICGLGDTDESEVSDIPNARPLQFPEEVMTEREAEQLTLSHRASGLDQWKCTRATAMQLIKVSTDLKTRGIDDDIIKSWLPTGLTSRKDLDEEQATDFAYSLEMRLLLFNLCGQLADKGVDQETMRMRLPNGATSLITLTLSQTLEAIKSFKHWLDTYNQVVEGSVINA